MKKWLSIIVLCLISNCHSTRTYAFKTSDAHAVNCTISYDRELDGKGSITVEIPNAGVWEGAVTEQNGGTFRGWYLGQYHELRDKVMSDTQTNTPKVTLKNMQEARKLDSSKSIEGIISIIESQNFRRKNE